MFFLRRKIGGTKGPRPPPSFDDSVADHLLTMFRRMANIGSLERSPEQVIHKYRNFLLIEQNNYLLEENANLRRSLVSQKLDHECKTFSLYERNAELEDRVRELETQIQSPPQSPPTIPKKKGPKKSAAIRPVFPLPPPTIVAPAIVSINHDSLAPDFGQPLKKPPGAERPALLTVTKAVDAKTPLADAVGTHSTRIAIRRQLLGLGLSAVAPKPPPSSSSVVIAAPLRIKTPAQINVMKAIPEGEANKKNLGGSGYNDGKFDKGKGKEKANPEEEVEGNREENDWTIYETLPSLSQPSTSRQPALRKVQSSSSNVGSDLPRLLAVRV